MAITVVGFANNGAGNNSTSGNWDVSGIGFNAGDLALCWWYARNSTKTITEPASVTQKHDFAGGAGFGRLFVGYRYLQAGDTTFGWTASNVSTVTVLWGCVVIRGGPSSGDPFETQSGTPVTFTDTLSPNPPATTPTSNDSIVVTCFGANNDYTTVTAPTNYTIQNTASITLGADGSYGVATRILVGGGGASEDPAVFTRTGGAATDDGVVWTASIAPFAATTFFQTIAAVAVPVATLTTSKTILKTLAAVAAPVATLATALLFSVTMAATAVGAASMTLATIFTETLAAIATGVATLGTLFIAGPGAGIGRFYSGFIAAVGRLMNR